MQQKFVTLEEEYERNKELKKEEVKVLMEWAEKQPHLPKISELQIARFLHCSSFSSEAAKTTIENYFTVRTLCPELFANRTKETLKNHTNVVLFSWLPQVSPAGENIVFCKLLNHNPEIWDYVSMNMLLNMYNTLCLAQNGCCKGLTLVIDAAGHTFGHIMKINLSVLRKQMFYLQEAMPIQVHSVHVFNTSAVVDKVLSMLKPLMKGKLIENIHIHSTMESLYKFIPKSYLPSDYGGQGAPVETLKKETERNIFDNMDFFKEEEKQVVDNSRRIEKSKLDDLMGIGIEGTFKKLDID